MQLLGRSRCSWRRVCANSPIRMHVSSLVCTSRGMNSAPATSNDLHRCGGRGILRTRRERRVRPRPQATERPHEQAGDDKRVPAGTDCVTSEKQHDPEHWDGNVSHGAPPRRNDKEQPPAAALERRSFLDVERHVPPASPRAAVEGPVGTGVASPPWSPMGVTLSSRCRVRAGVSLVEWALDAADLVEKSEAEGRKASPRVQL
jgi:hypothetical protein